MNELIDKLENEMGLPFYFLERPEEQVNIICYRYTKEFVISDIIFTCSSGLSKK